MAVLSVTHAAMALQLCMRFTLGIIVLPAFPPSLKFKIKEVPSCQETFHSFIQLSFDSRHGEYHHAPLSHLVPFIFTLPPCFHHTFNTAHILRPTLILHILSGGMSYRNVTYCLPKTTRKFALIVRPFRSSLCSSACRSN